MSTLSSVREFARAEAPSFSFGRAFALLAGTAVVGVEALMNRAELSRLLGGGRARRRAPSR